MPAMRAAAVVCVLGILTAGCFPAVRVSVSSTGLQANGLSVTPHISTDGRYVAFASGATNLVPGDTNGVGDVFVRDTVRRTTTRASVGSGGLQGNGSVIEFVMSDDGRYVAFNTAATNLHPNDTNGRYDVFVRDTAAGTTQLVSHTPAGGTANRESWPLGVTPDGKVLIHTAATDIAGVPQNGEALDLYDITSDAFQLVAVPSPCPPGGTPTLGGADMSPDASQIVYTTGCNVVGNSSSFVLLDRAANRSILLHTRSNDVSDANFTAPQISRDGRTVVWSEDGVAANGRFSDLWISEDGRTPTTIRTAVPTIGNVEVSASGRYIAYAWAADYTWTFVPPLRIAALDRVTGVTVDASVNMDGKPANGDSVGPSINANETKIAFQSTASDLTVGDTNAASDIFVRNLDSVFSNTKAPPTRLP